MAWGLGTHLLGREHLEVPVGRGIWVREDVVGEEGQTGTVEARRHDDHVALNFHFTPGAAFGHAFRAAVESDAVFGEADDVAAQPFGMAFADLVEDVRIHHRRAGEEPLFRRRQIFEIAVEEDAEKTLGDPGEDCFFAEHVEGEEYVDDGIAGDDPFVGAGEHGGLGRVGVDDEFESFYGRGAAADDQDFFAFRGFAGQMGGVEDLALEDFLVGYMGHFWLAAGPDGGHDTIVTAVRGVVDDPAALLVFVYGGNSSVELCTVLKAVLLPNLGNLGDNLLAIWIAGGPLQGREETVHDAVDLEAAGVVDSLQGRFSTCLSDRF